MSGCSRGVDGRVRRGLGKQTRKEVWSKIIEVSSEVMEVLSKIEHSAVKLKKSS